VDKLHRLQDELDRWQDNCQGCRTSPIDCRTNRAGLSSIRIGCRMSMYGAGQEGLVGGLMEQAAGQAV